MNIKNENNINYNELLNKYNTKFEGVSNPVFYDVLYPTHRAKTHGDYPNPNYDYNSDITQNYLKALGLKIKLNKDFDMNIIDVPEKYKYSENTSEKELYNFFKNNYFYHNLFKNFIETIIKNNPDKKIGVITIPSSKVNVKNGITFVVEEVISLGNYDNQIKDYTDKLYRIKKKEAAHDGGNRSIAVNLDTLKLEYVNDVDIIVVVDDIVTTGNSFNAVNKMLIDSGFKGEIINYALFRSMSEVAHNNYNEWQDKQKDIWNDGSNKKNGKIDGIIFDFDQTLVDTTKKNEDFENISRKFFEKDNCQILAATDVKNDYINNFKKIYKVYDEKFMIYLQSKEIPFAILSNNSKIKVNLIYQMNSIFPYIYPNIEKDGKAEKYDIKLYMQKEMFLYSSLLPNNIFFPPKIDGKNHDGVDTNIPLTKPCEDGVINAINYLKNNFNLKDKSRIIGIGNTPEDIIAYHKAGIESVLGLWGVPDILKDYAANNWGADYVFNNFSDFSNWVILQNQDITYVDHIEEYTYKNINILDEANKINKEFYDKKFSTKNCIVYYEEIDGKYEIKISRAKEDKFLQSIENREVKVLASQLDDKQAHMLIIDMLLQADINKINLKYIIIYPIIEYFAHQKEWKKIDELSKKYNLPITISKNLKKYYDNDDLINYEPDDNEYKIQNIKAKETLLLWKAQKLEWPGITSEDKL